MHLKHALKASNPHFRKLEKVSGLTDREHDSSSLLTTEGWPERFDCILASLNYSLTIRVNPIFFGVRSGTLLSRWLCNSHYYCFAVFRLFEGVFLCSGATSLERLGVLLLPPRAVTLFCFSYLHRLARPRCSLHLAFFNSAIAK